MSEADEFAPGGMFDDDPGPDHGERSMLLNVAFEALRKPWADHQQVVVAAAHLLNQVREGDVLVALSASDFEDVGGVWQLSHEAWRRVSQEGWEALEARRDLGLDEQRRRLRPEAP